MKTIYTNGAIFMFMRRRKGISPLIAAVLLVVFTVAISAMVVNWLSSYTSTTTQSASNSSANVVRCAQQNLGVSAIYVTVNTTAAGNETFRISAVNTGTGTVTLISGNVFNDTGDSCSLSTLGAISQGGVNQLTGNCDILTSSTCADFERVQLVTSCGLVSKSTLITKCTSTT